MTRTTAQKNAERKQQLLAEGAVLRANIMLAKDELRESMQVDTLARKTFSLLGRVALNAWQARSGIAGVVGANARTLLPWIARAASAVSGKGWARSLLRSGLIAGAVTGAVYYLRRGRNRHAAVEDYDLDAD